MLIASDIENNHLLFESGLHKLSWSGRPYPRQLKEPCSDLTALYDPNAMDIVMTNPPNPSNDQSAALLVEVQNTSG